MSLRELYHEIIMDHGKQPRNKGKIINASHSQVGHNPLCGDKLILYVMASHGIVDEIRFEGVGCAISVASASLMSEMVKGKTTVEIEMLFEQFHHLVTQGQELTTTMGKLAAFSGVSEFPMRVKCATLAWHTLKAALANQSSPVSTE
jgi:nitrogen fixation NifU-like protein